MLSDKLDIEDKMMTTFFLSLQDLTESIQLLGGRRGKVEGGERKPYV